MSQKNLRKMYSIVLTIINFIKMINASLYFLENSRLKTFNFLVKCYVLSGTPEIGKYGYDWYILMCISSIN